MSSSENSFDYLPHFSEGKVVHGFGRGGAELGIPTANFPDDVVAQLPKDFVCGVYYGWACVNTLSKDVHKMVMCCGWNKHFHNTIKTMETHILHKYDNDFYGENLRIIVLGYIRPMEAYNSLDALIEAMNNDILQSEKALSLPAMMEFSQHPFLTKQTTTTVPNTETVDENSTMESGHGDSVLDKQPISPASHVVSGVYSNDKSVNSVESLNDAFHRSDQHRLSGEELSALVITDQEKERFSDKCGTKSNCDVITDDPCNNKHEIKYSHKAGLDSNGVASRNELNKL